MFLEGYKKKILDIFRQLKAIKEDKYYESESHSVMSYSFWPTLFVLYNPRISPDQNTEVSSQFPKGTSKPRDRTQISLIVGRFFTNLYTREAQ